MNNKLSKKMIITLGIAVVVIAVIAVVIISNSNTISAWTNITVLKDKVIVVDAGHGGSDGGAVGVNGTIEDEINLEIALRLEQALKNAGAEVIMTRKDERALADTKKGDMAERRRIISESNADIILSIHQNIHTNRDAKGPQVFYYPGSEKGEVLAVDIQAALNEALKPQKPRSALPEDYMIVRTGKSPGVIIECGFLSNAEEEALLKKSAYQVEIIRAIITGVSNYFNDESPV